MPLAPAQAESGFALADSLSQGSIAVGVAPPATLRLTLDGTNIPLTADRRFLIGFDRDHRTSARLEARLPDGRVISETLTIVPRAWPIEHVNVARRPGGATEDYLRIRAVELERIAAARAAAPEGDGWRQSFVWPARGRISGRFGAQRVYRGEPAAYHSGTDIAAGAGAPVVAPADGIVVLAPPPAFTLEGNLVIIDHGMGLNSAFLHLATSHVQVGQHVRQGQLIGTVGASGRASGPHLHWSLMWRGARLDPELIARDRPN